MSTLIRKTESGKVQIVRNGAIAVSLLPSASLKIIDDKEVQIRDTSGLVTSVEVGDVAYTQLEPAAKVAFTGDAQALVELLDGSFFFDIAADGANLFTQNGAFAGLWGNGQSLNLNNGGSSTLTINTLYVFPTFIDGLIKGFRMVRTGGVAVGSFNWAIYKAEDLGSGLIPTDKIYQGTEFTLAGSGQLFIDDISSSPIDFDAGVYFFGVQMDASFVFQAGSTVNYLGFPNTTGSAAVRGYAKAATYASTMPSTWDYAGSTADISMASLPILYYQK